MRIVDRATFLTLPPGTVYTDYEPCIFGELCIKDATWPSSDGVPAHGDWLFYCATTAHRGGCCGSCIDDFADGYGMFDDRCCCRAEAS